MHYHVYLNSVQGRPMPHGFPAPTQRGAEFLMKQVRAAMRSAPRCWWLGRVGSLKVGPPCGCKDARVYVPDGYKAAGPDAPASPTGADPER